MNIKSMPSLPLSLDIEMQYVRVSLMSLNKNKEFLKEKIKVHCPRKFFRRGAAAGSTRNASGWSKPCTPVTDLRFMDLTIKHL